VVRETAQVGVVVERRALKNPWVDHAWMPVGVLVGAPAAAPWTALHETATVTSYYAGTAEIEFFGTDTTMYRENLRSEQPSLWVSLRRTDVPPGVLLQLVTADPADAEALTEAGTDIIEAVPMPVEIQRQLAAFVEVHHVERPFVKRKRDRANPEFNRNRAARRGDDKE
jgi:hypothetical protein